jgi:hypothetical protein
VAGEAAKTRDGGTIMPVSVFLSHSSRDNAFCERLALNLTEYDVRVWYDQWEIKVGDSLRGKIAAGIEANDYLAVVLSGASVESQWVQQELNAALARELREREVVVLPLLIEDCKMPTFLEDKKYADFRTDYDEGLKQVLDRVGAKKRAKKRSVIATQSTVRRNDELAFEAAYFEQWFLDRLEEGNEMRIQRHFWNWRDAVRAIKPALFPEDIPARQFDIDAAGQALLEKMAISGNALVRYGQGRWCDRVIELLYDAYLLVNAWGTNSGASIDMNVRTSAARCRILDVVFALGAAAMDQQEYGVLRRALSRNTPDAGYWERRGWFRYTLTMAARGTPDRRQTWYLPLPRALEYVKSRPSLRTYFRDDEAVLDYLCQFDLVQCLYWVLHSQDRDPLHDSYPSCALYAPRRVEPLVRSLILREEPASLLGDYSDAQLAVTLKGFARIMGEGASPMTYRGWADEGWDDPMVRDFLATHGKDVPQP